MKRYKNILILFLSFVFIYVGAGVSIIHFCSDGCKTIETCCTAHECCGKCENDHDSDHTAHFSHHHNCSTVVYRLDFIEHSVEDVNLSSCFQLICQELPELLIPSDFISELPINHTNLSPPPIGSRHYLALYSVLII